jgi:cyclophilin family peptidyl-prolyl cis-trans isomerase/HEAT repeat protein
MRPLAVLTILTCAAPLLVACPKSAPEAAKDGHSVRPPATPDAATLKHARILRAADRRIVDDDLKVLLTDGDPAVRARAVLVLGQIGAADATAALDTAASDEAPIVRPRAARGMGRDAARDSLPTLTRLAADADAGVRASTAEALGRLADPSSLPAVRALLGDADAAVRTSAALAAWKLPEPEPLLDELITRLGTEDPAVRRAAAYALARLGSAGIGPASSGAAVGRVSDPARVRIREALAARVTDGDVEIKMQIARGLSSPQTPAELSVVGTLSGDPEARVRATAARALGFPGVPIMPYLSRAATDRDFGVARVALESLGKVGGGQATDRLKEVVMKLNGSWLRQAALVSLVQEDAQTAQSVVQGLLENPDPVMRATAATMLVGRRDAWAIQAVGTLMRDPAPQVAAVALPLVAENDEAIGEQLEEQFRAGDPIVRAAAAEAVGARFTRPRAAVESRADLFAHLDAIWKASEKDALPDARLAVLDAAAKAGRDDKTRAAFARGLTDRDVVVRRRAVRCLSEVYAEDHASAIGPHADRPLEDYVRIVQWAESPHAAVITLERPDTLPGRFVVALDAEAAPMTAWNFAQLAGRGFYDGRRVHRVVPAFVVQDGDPRGDGYGGPGYSIRDEWNPLRYTEGVLGMASDGKDTAGSQWFVTLTAQPHLDGRYTSFGRVTQGLRQIVTQILPEDTVVSIRVYEGDGTEPIQEP